MVVYAAIFQNVHLTVTNAHFCNHFSVNRPFLILSYDWKWLLTFFCTAICHSYIDKCRLVMSNFTSKHFRRKIELHSSNDQQSVSRRGHSERCRRECKGKVISAWASSKNRLRAGAMAQELSIQNTGTRLGHQILSSAAWLAGRGSEHDATVLSQANNAARREETLASRGWSSTDTKAQNVYLVIGLDAIKLKTGKLWFTLLRKQVTIKATISSIVALGEQVEPLESTNGVLLQTNV